MSSKLNYGKTFLLGFGFLGISIIWRIFNQYIPIFLQAGNPDFERQLLAEGRAIPEIVGFGLAPGLALFIMTWDNIRQYVHPTVGRCQIDRTPHRLAAAYPASSSVRRLRLLGFDVYPRRAIPDRDCSPVVSAARAWLYARYARPHDMGALFAQLRRRQTVSLTSWAASAHSWPMQTGGSITILWTQCSVYWLGRDLYRSALHSSFTSSSKSRERIGERGKRSPVYLRPMRARGHQPTKADSSSFSASYSGSWASLRVDTGLLLFMPENHFTLGMRATRTALCTLTCYLVISIPFIGRQIGRRPHLG